MCVHGSVEFFSPTDFRSLDLDDLNYRFVLWIPFLVPRHLLRFLCDLSLTRSSRLKLISRSL